MITIPGEVTYDLADMLKRIEVLERFTVVFFILLVVLVFMFVCAYLGFDKLNQKRIDYLEELLDQEVEKNRALEYKVRFYCDRAVILPIDDKKKGKKK